MKKFNLFLYMLLGMTMAFAVACGSDDDDDNGGSGDMDTPKYEAESALYRVTDRSSQYESVEFTASGNYIITKKEGTRAPQQIAAVRRSMIMALPQVKGFTRSYSEYDDIIYGTYSVKGDTYVLDGFGEIVVNGGGSNAVSLDITTKDGRTVTVGAQMENQYSSSSQTNKLCRTWKLVKFGMKVVEDGKTQYDKTFNSYASFVRAWAEMLGEEYDAEELAEILDETPEQVIFTKSGTYVVFYSNGALAVSTWKWTNESKGQARYSWDYESINDPYESGAFTVEYEGKQLILTEYEEEDDDYSFEIKYYMNEVK